MVVLWRLEFPGDETSLPSYCPWARPPLLLPHFFPPSRTFKLTHQLSASLGLWVGRGGGGGNGRRGAGWLGASSAEDTT